MNTRTAPVPAAVLDSALATELDNDMPADDPRRSALRRIAASRAKLQVLWLPETVPGARGVGGPGHLTRRLRALWRRWRGQLTGTPVAALALNAVETWWQQNPWRAAGEAVADELQHAATPWVRRHPVIAVALAAAAGGAVAAARPWTWPVVARQLRPLPARVGRWALAQLGQAPWQSLILGALLAGATAARAAATEPSPEPSAEASPASSPAGDLHESR